MRCRGLACPLGTILLASCHSRSDWDSGLLRYHGLPRVNPQSKHVILLADNLSYELNTFQVAVTCAARRTHGISKARCHSDFQFEKVSALLWVARSKLVERHGAQFVSLHRQRFRSGQQTLLLSHSAMSILCWCLPQQNRGNSDRLINVYLGDRLDGCL